MPIKSRLPILIEIKSGITDTGIDKINETSS